MLQARTRTPVPLTKTLLQTSLHLRTSRQRTSCLKRLRRCRCWDCLAWVRWQPASSAASGS